MNEGRITIKDGFGAMDFEAVTAMLATAYWSPGISRGEVERGARGSALVCGAFTGEGGQAGYARVVSDMTRFAYIMDVMVSENLRGRGIGRALVRHVLAHPDLRVVYHWLLATKDAHGLYAKEGFNTLETRDAWMEIRRPRPAG